MSQELTIKYFPENELCREPFQASEDAAGYDLFAAETLTLFPNTGCISLAFRFAIPKGYYGKIFQCSGLLNDHFATCDARVLDSDFRGIVLVIMINHHPEKTFTIRTGDRIVQYVFMKKYNVKIFDVAFLGLTKRGADGFGSTGGVTKVIKLDDSDSDSEKL